MFFSVMILTTLKENNKLLITNVFSQRYKDGKNKLHINESVMMMSALY